MKTPAKRTLSAEESGLWQQVARTVTPLRPQKPEPGKGAPTAMPATMPVAMPEPGISARAGLRDSTALGRPPPGRPAARPPSYSPPLSTPRSYPPEKLSGPIDDKTARKLLRGRLSIDARLDLHGMTQQQAHDRLAAFLRDSHRRGARHVLVITGKGRDGAEHVIAPHRHGILRHSLPHWLSAPPLAGRVLDLAPAHRKHGGGGAYYVYLRRQR